LMAGAAGMPDPAVALTLTRFGTRAADNPGRLERWLYRGATVLIDYAHNPDGLANLLQVARQLQPRRLGLLLGQAGIRDDAAIAELARTAAGFAPDVVVIKELPGMLRGRTLGEIPALLRMALSVSGYDTTRVVDQADELIAARVLLAWGEPGDVIVLPIHTDAVRAAVALELAPAAQA